MRRPFTLFLVALLAAVGFGVGTWLGRPVASLRWSVAREDRSVLVGVDAQGQLLVGNHGRHAAKLWRYNPRTGESLGVLELPEKELAAYGINAAQATLTDDGRKLLLPLNSPIRRKRFQQIVRCDALTGAIEQRYEKDTNWAFSEPQQRGGVVAAAAAMQMIVCWDTATGKELAAINFEPASIACFTLSPDGQKVAVARRPERGVATRLLLYSTRGEKLAEVVGEFQHLAWQDANILDGMRVPRTFSRFTLAGGQFKEQQAWQFPDGAHHALVVRSGYLTVGRDEAPAWQVYLMTKCGDRIGNWARDFFTCHAEIRLHEPATGVTHLWPLTDDHYWENESLLTESGLVLQANIDGREVRGWKLDPGRPWMALAGAVPGLLLGLVLVRRRRSAEISPPSPPLAPPAPPRR